MNSVQSNLSWSWDAGCTKNPGFCWLNTVYCHYRDIQVAGWCDGGFAGSVGAVSHSGNGGCAPPYDRWQLARVYLIEVDVALILIAVFASVAGWRVMATRRARTRSPGRQPPSSSPVAGYAAWALAGLLAVAAAFTILSIGVFLAPLAIVALWVAAWLSPDRQALSGLLVGAGLFAAVVSIAGAPRGAERVVWSLAGLASIAVGIAGYLVLRPRSPSAAR